MGVSNLCLYFSPFLSYNRKRTAVCGGFWDVGKGCACSVKKEMKKNHHMPCRAAAGILALLLLAGAAGCQQTTESASASGPSSTAVSQPKKDGYPEGTSVDGIDISGCSVEEAIALCKPMLDEKIRSLSVTVKNKTGELEITGEEVGVSTDRLSDSLTQLKEKNTPGAYKFALRSDLDAIKAILTNGAAALETEAKDATVEGFDSDAGEFRFTPSEDGEAVDVEKTAAAVQDLFTSGGGTVEPVMKAVPAEVTEDDLREKFVRLSEYTTESTNTENGNYNMALALEYVNGTVLQPGDTFSYEATIGNSTDPAGGWKQAGGLSGGAIVQMYGGGICQASSTIYVAAVKAGMTIVERNEHSNPSTYIPKGLDAMVSYGDFDLRFTNELDSAVYIMSWMDGTTLHVEFYGKKQDDWDSIEVYSEETGTTPPLDTVSYVVDNGLAQGEVSEPSSGNYGYTARAWREYIKDGVTVKTEELRSSEYPATGTIYRVGPGTDINALRATPTPRPTSNPWGSVGGVGGGTDGTVYPWGGGYYPGIGENNPWGGGSWGSGSWGGSITPDDNGGATPAP